MGNKKRTDSNGLNMKRIEALVDLAKAKGLAELEYQVGDGESVRFRLHREQVASTGAATAAAALAPLAGAASAQAATPLPPAPLATPPSPAPTAVLHPIISPFVGTFYRAPSPGAPPFVEPGSLVKRGQVLCIVEAMKLMNEIESDCEGRVVEILVANGEPVEYGETLFKVEPLSARA